MLDCAWRWAVAHSFDRPGALPSEGTFRSASEARVHAAQWLVWRSAVTSLRPHKPPASEKDLNSTLADLMTELAGIASQGPARLTPGETVDAGERAQRLFDTLTPPARQIVSTLLHLGRDPVGLSRTVDVKTVGSSLGVSADSLQGWVGDALKQLQKIKGKA
jgi:hypothetical protein